MLDHQPINFIVIHAHDHNIAYIKSIQMHPPLFNYRTRQITISENISGVAFIPFEVRVGMSGSAVNCGGLHPFWAVLYWSRGSLKWGMVVRNKAPHDVKFVPNSLVLLAWSGFIGLLRMWPRVRIDWPIGWYKAWRSISGIRK